VSAERVVVIGAGIGGLAAALDLAVQGADVTVVERAGEPGGKMREVALAGTRLDAGPTVFTMRHVFDGLFADADTALERHLRLQPVGILARHAWSAREHLDLHADLERSVDAIGAFAGPAEARGYREFAAHARRVYDTLERSFIHAPRPSLLGLARGGGRRRLVELWRMRPFATMCGALRRHFRDPRLLQLFGRYATYCGSSPFAAPATLMLIAHVERDGVWLIDGGMHRLAVALAAVARGKGARFRYATEVAEVSTRHGVVDGVRLADGDRIDADAVVVNADVGAVGAGRFGSVPARALPRVRTGARSLSAVTWTLVAEAAGFPLLRHSVFFSGDYKAEFDDLFRRSRLPAAPTVYVCAQDRGDRDRAGPGGPERLLCLVNAPPTGDTRPLPASEVAQCEERTFRLLQHCGLSIHRRRDRMQVTTPVDFERLFPGTGGALYGRASHGWMASFRRPGCRTAIPGMYLAGGSTHPGPGVPMAALSGRMAAQAVLTDLRSTDRFRRGAMRGGTSTR